MLYNKRTWKRKRAIILRRDKYLCRNCKRYGRKVGATTVHHMIPLSVDSSLAMCSNNLLSLCNKCHEKMHDRTGDELTALGAWWAERVKV